MNDSHKDRIRAHWQALRASEPGLRTRDAAERLGISELELLLAVEPSQVRLVRTKPRSLLSQLEKVGPVTVLTRNRAAILEYTGVYGPFAFLASQALVLGAPVDLRLHLRHWKYILAVGPELLRARQPSLQIFDRQGNAVQKIVLTQTSDLAAFRTLIDPHAAPPSPFTLPARSQSKPRGLAPILPEVLQRQWEAMADTHDSLALQRRLRLHRIQALALLDHRWAFPLPPGAALEHVLSLAAQSAVPVMLFVGNAGAVQIYSGTLQRVAQLGPWINVLDSTVNLHVFAPRLRAAWLVRKPTRDGTVTSLEFFEEDGTLALQVFGLRKPGTPELAAWREIAERAAQLASARAPTPQKPPASQTA